MQRTRRDIACPTGVFSSMTARVVALAIAAVPGMCVSASAQTLTITTASGVAVGGANPSWSASIGTANGLGLGTPSAGVSLITTGVAGGVLYTTPVNLVTSANGNQRLALNVYASVPFAHAAVVQPRLCYPIAGCATAAGYQSISTNSAVPTEILPSNSNAGTYELALGVAVSDVNGASAFTGGDSVTLTFRTYKSNGSNDQLNDTDTLVLSATVQTALRLTLSAAGGLAVSPDSDYSLTFGSVNGLGIGPAAGLTVTTSSTNSLYATPYALRPSFTGFSSTTATLQARVSTDFAHPAVLELRDSPDSSTFTAISKLAASPTTLTTTAASSASVTRYLGLFVSGVNGAGAFTGADTAILQFTLVVP